MSARGKIFHGWVIVAVAWVVYGFGISPAFYSWGFFVTEDVRDELGINRTGMGAVKGLFVWIYSAAGPLVGIALSRYGPRKVMAVGACLTAIGLFITSQAHSVLLCFVGYSVIAGLGVGFSTIIPAQTLGSNWFIKYRARAIAIILTAGGIVGKLVLWIDARLLENSDWRMGWVVWAVAAIVIALLALLFIRDTPEQLCLRPDGDPPDPTQSPAPDMLTKGTPVIAMMQDEHQWTAARAIRTWQFALITIGGIAYAVPWGVVVDHVPSHLEDMGFTKKFAAASVGTMALVSIAGRLSGGLGDFMAPNKVLAMALVIEGFGVGGLYFAQSEALVYVSLATVGVGFGMGYISVPVVFSSFFGRRAFATTSGTRMLISGTFNAFAPIGAGMIFDVFGSYDIAFITCVVLTLVGAVAVFMAKPPGLAPPEAAAGA